MNQAASSKFGAIAKHLGENVKLLDFGSGFSRQNSSNKWRKQELHYVPMMFHKLFNLGLQENNIDFVTKEQLENAENEFDIISACRVYFTN